MVHVNEFVKVSQAKHDKQLSFFAFIGKALNY